MRILVTGGAGFIGSHICRELLSRGHVPIVIDTLQSGVDLMPDHVERWCIDLHEVDLYQCDNIDAVIHAAAVADISRNWEDATEREMLWYDNVDGTMALLESMGPKPIVFLSTCAVYGDAEAATENWPIVATSPYAASKLAGEFLVQAYAHKHGSRWYNLRLASAVGSGYHHGHIADFVRQYQREGQIRPNSQPSIGKSYVHVKDVARIACDMLNPIGRVWASGAYNVARQTWSCRDTLRVMGVRETSYENKARGWVGDPIVHASSVKLGHNGPLLNVEDGVRDALSSLGWTYPNGEGR